MAFNGCLKCQLSISTKMNVISICTCIIDFTVRLKSIQNIKEIKPLTNTKNIKYYAIKSLNEHFIIYLVFGGKRDLYNIFNSSYREVLMYLTAFLFFPANMSDVEREWKLEFYQWKTNYMVQWQKQFDKFVKSYEDRLQSCSAPQAEA